MATWLYTRLESLESLEARLSSLVNKQVGIAGEDWELLQVKELQEDDAMLQELSVDKGYLEGLRLKLGRGAKSRSKSEGRVEGEGRLQVRRQEN